MMTTPRQTVDQNCGYCKMNMHQMCAQFRHSKVCCCFGEPYMKPVPGAAWKPRRQPAPKAKSLNDLLNPPASTLQKLEDMNLNLGQLAKDRRKIRR